MDLPLKFREVRLDPGQALLMIAVCNHMNRSAGKIRQGFRALNVTVVDQHRLGSDACRNRMILAGKCGLAGQARHPDMGVVFPQHRENFGIVVGNPHVQLHPQLFGKEFRQLVVVAGRPVLFLNIDRGGDPGNNMQNPFFTNLLKSGGL